MSFTVRRLDKAKKSKRVFPWRRALILALELSGPALAWYGQWKVKHEQKMQQKYRVLFMKKFLLILIAILCSFLLLAGTVKGLMALRIISLGNVASVAGSLPATDANGHLNFLLLGQGDAGHDGKDLTDTIMIASIDPENTNSVVLMSLPRDLYFLKSEKMGKGRINGMYRDYKSYLRFQQGMDEEEATTEAMSELAAEVGRKLNMEIPHVIKVDFIGFVKAVDTLDGIELDVPYDILDTEYPDNNYGYETFEIRKGLQTLDGETALKYARSRHTTSDFDRSARQQQVIKGLAAKAKSTGFVKDPGKVAQLYRVLSDHIKTTLTMRELVGLADVGRDLDTERIITMQISDRNGLYGSVAEKGGFLYTPPRNLFEGASVLLPVSIPEFPISWKQLQTLTALIMEQRKLYLAKPQIAVLNAGAREGSARRLAYELTRYGFDVVNIANASVPDQPISTISVRDPNEEGLATIFGVLLGMATNPLPGDLPAEEAAQVTIIIGEQYDYTPLQDVIPTT